MQNRYTGDIGDFSKFALIESLTGNDLRLGVLWYLNTAEERNSDGALTSYYELRKYNPDLFEKLSSVGNGNNRCIAALEACGVVPKNSLFFGAPVPTSSRLDSVAGFSQRDQWIRTAADSVREADVLFLDPDNGMAPPGVAKSSGRSVKYVYVEEIAYLFANGHSLVFYQHHQRKPLEACVSEQIKKFSELTTTWALSFHKRSLRTYFVLAQAKHKDILWDRTIRLMNSPMGVDGCFRLHTLVRKVCASERPAKLGERTA